MFLNISDKERNYYLDPDFILDFPTFNQYLDKYGTASLQQMEQVPEPVFTLDSFYTSGDPIYIVYPNESIGQMILPATSTTSFCTDQNPMGKSVIFKPYSTYRHFLTPLKQDDFC